MITMSPAKDIARYNRQLQEGFSNSGIRPTAPKRRFRIMRDTYVLVLFIAFIGAGTFLAYSGKVDPQLIMTPIVTGFLGLLASTRPTSNSEKNSKL